MSKKTKGQELAEKLVWKASKYWKGCAKTDCKSRKILRGI